MSFENLSTYISIPLAHYPLSSFNARVFLLLCSFSFFSVSSNVRNDSLLIIMIPSEQNGSKLL